MIDEYQYAYDRAGNRTAKNNVLDSALDEDYTYDALDRLTEWKLNGSTQETWTLDSLGNNLNTSTGGTYNAANEQTSIAGSTVTPTYDAAGNMTTLSTGNTAKYDAWNRLVLVSDGSGTIERYEYDGTNRQIQAFSAYTGGTPATTLDNYHQGQQVIETRENSQIKYQNIWSARYIDAMVCRDTYSGNELVSTQGDCTITYCPNRICVR